MSWNEEKVSKEEHDKEIRDLKWEHEDEMRDARLDKQASDRQSAQRLEDAQRAFAFEKEALNASHESEVRVLTHKLNHVSDERVKASEARAIEAETKVAVLEAKLELAGKTEEVGAQVLEAKDMIESIKSLTEKVIDKLPVLDISNISVNVPQNAQQNKGGDNKGGNQEKKA